MTPGRIRNGIDLDALEAFVRGREKAPDLTVRTEWIGGAQSVATISRDALAAPSASTFVVHVDESSACLGNGTGPAPAELAAVALSAAFAQAFVIAASRDNVTIDALSVNVGRSAPPGATAPPRWRIECTVDSDAAPLQLRAFTRAAIASELVRSLAMRAPSVSIVRAHDKERDMT
jgi:hypothetical protein